MLDASPIPRHTVCGGNQGMVMVLMAAVRKVFWPTVDWTVAILDAVRVAAVLSAHAANVAARNTGNTR